MFFMDSILRTDVPLEERIAVVKVCLLSSNTHLQNVLRGDDLDYSTYV